MVKTPIYEYHKDLYGERFDSDKRLPVYTEDPISDYDTNLIHYRINNSTFKFTDIFFSTKKIFNDLEISNSDFVLYPDTGHDLNDEIYKDVVSFFDDVIN